MIDQIKARQDRGNSYSFGTSRAKAFEQNLKLNVASRLGDDSFSGAVVKKEDQ
jgi:hypothetical protein